MSDKNLSSTEDEKEDMRKDSKSVHSFVKKEPPPEKLESIKTRSTIILSFWVIILAVGIPIWWVTTAIYRASLPLDQMMDWANGRVLDPREFSVFPLRILIEAESLSELEAQNLLRATQHALDDLNDFSAHHLRLQLSPSSKITLDELPVNLSGDVALLIRLIPDVETSAQLHQHSPILNIYYALNQAPSSPSSSGPLATYITHYLRALFAEERSMISHLLSNSSSDHLVDNYLTDSLQKWTSRTIKYSPSYHLTFSLFTPSSEPRTWPISNALDTHMKPLLNLLYPTSNFTIDTQIQFYATPGVTGKVLRQEDLSHFVNASEWPLSPSIGIAPTVNFIVYAGDIEIEGGAKSWLIPQWGGVTILPPSEVDDLRPVMLIFAKQLMSLLGAPETGNLPLRLQTLSRVRSASLLLKASSTLGSLARLSLALPGISIPRSVSDGVSKTIINLELACAGLAGPAGLEYARQAEQEAEKAFFEKSMVGQVYFPDEHKVAVYLPLLGPVGVPLVIGAIKEVKAWIKRREKAH
ncbi:putative GPI transamidase [Blumeria hordei DH14]|uniref:Putative GPI transamidase n=1 Tax=Blumeria graminis f. sp. hordei (strain DH14) TaxID=546991 RepID=N1J504_BLUG1|nr:putative GPI transamidase [Blumeria hordei DH14]